MVDGLSLLAKISSGAEDVTITREECLALLELLEAAAEATSAMEPCFAEDLHRKWWQILPELELAHARLAKAVEGIESYENRAG